MWRAIPIVIPSRHSNKGEKSKNYRQMVVVLVKISHYENHNLR